MKRAFLSCGFFFLFSSSLFALNPPSYENSYGELAREFVFPAYRNLEQKVFLLQKKVWPHQVKSLRKEVAQVRFYLDFFSFSYPIYEEMDLLYRLREHLDKGYDVLGGFKDLYDGLEIPKQEEITPDHYKGVLSKVKKRRKSVLKWKEELQFFSSRNFLFLYFGHPLVEHIQKREAKKLSRYVWRFVETPRVKEENFHSIMKRFLVSTLERAGKMYEEVGEIHNVFDPHEQEEIFHSFRKTLRYVVKIKTFFPGFFPWGVTSSTSYDVLVHTVSRYGDLNDLFMIESELRNELEGTTYEEAQEITEKIHRVKSRAERAWNELLHWQEEQDVKGHIKSFMKSIQSL